MTQQHDIMEYTEVEPVVSEDMFTVRFYTSLDLMNEEIHHVPTSFLYPGTEGLEYLKQ